MNVVFWAFQGILALIFIVLGEMKSTHHIPRLALRVKWVNDFEPEVIRLVGIAELLGGFGLILPMMTNIQPILTPIAACALAVVMVLAAIYHFRKGQHMAIRLNLALFVICLAIAFYRFSSVDPASQICATGK